MIKSLQPLIDNNDGATVERILETPSFRFALTHQTRYTIQHLMRPQLIVLLLATLGRHSFASVPPELHVGTAGHAFDHLGSIGQQADAAAASGANIIYVTGLGGVGYNGLPAADEVQRQRAATQTYIRDVRRKGIKLAVGYVCATSIVNLGTFDRNWEADLRKQLHTPPAEWRQQGRDGKPLPSWYGGAYQPACMCNPDWRAYEKYIVRQQLESGCDGIFFDNPTVHPQGCYCQYCMENFHKYLDAHGLSSEIQSSTNAVAALRAYAVSHPNDFLRFRCLIARDFLEDIRTYARTINRHALITANNSLNSWDVLFSQCRTHAYNIYEMSQAEDFIVVEDMSSQPRVLPNGQTFEYGATYEQLHAIGHGKPVVAVTLAESDYHTPPRLVRLAMAEAAAHGASYMSWPTWPEKERQKMITQVLPEQDFLRKNSRLLNDVQLRQDVVLFLPFRKWVSTNQCVVSRLAAALTRANVQYGVMCEDDFSAGGFKAAALRGTKVLLAETLSDFTKDEMKLVDAFRKVNGSVVTTERTNWLREVRARIGEPSVEIEGPPTLRAVVYDQSKRTVIHLFNLNIQRVSSFEDKVTPATDIMLTCGVRLKRVSAVAAYSADADATSSPLKFRTKPTEDKIMVQAKVPRVDVSSIIVVEQ